MTTDYLARRDIEEHPAWCLNDACPSLERDGWREMTEVAVYREHGHSELLDEMPTCPECGATMTLWDELVGD